MIKLKALSNYAMLNIGLHYITSLCIFSVK